MILNGFLLVQILYFGERKKPQCAKSGNMESVIMHLFKSDFQPKSALLDMLCEYCFDAERNNLAGRSHTTDEKMAWKEKISTIRNRFDIASVDFFSNY